MLESKDFSDIKEMEIPGQIDRLIKLLAWVLMIVTAIISTSIFMPLGIFWALVIAVWRTIMVGMFAWVLRWSIKAIIWVIKGPQQQAGQ